MSTSTVTPPATSGSNSNPASDAAAAALGTASQLGPNSFITLLTAQLQNQDPDNPMDPTTMVTQLVEFNSLEQLIQINQNTTPASSSTNGTGANTNGSSN